MENISIHTKFEEYLLDNELPPSDILLELSQSRSGALSELANLERDIRIAELNMATMKERHIAIKKQLSTYDPIVAPVRRLSEDVLEAIFLHCLPVTRNGRPFVSEAPLLLTMVCKKWRIIAYRLLRLWTTLHIPIPILYSTLWRKCRFIQHPNVNKWKAYRSRTHAVQLVELEKWLLRSGTLPLSISLSSSQFMATADDFARSLAATETEFEPLAKSTFSVIAKFANRITKLDLAMPPSLLQWFDKATAGQLLILKCARISSLGQVSRSVYKDLSFTSGASIRELSVHYRKNILDLGLRNMIDKSLYCPLTSLSLHVLFCVSEARTILLACHDLQKFSIKLSNETLHTRRHPPTQGKEVPHILLPSLHTLCLQGRLKCIEALCQSLDTPLLNRFMLYTISPKVLVEIDHERYAHEVEDPYPPENIKALYTFLGRCSNLNHLTIDPSHLLASEIQAIFHNTLNVEHLVIENYLANVPGSYPEPVGTYGKTSLYTGTISDFVYNLHPLLKQERVSKETATSTSTYQDPVNFHLTKNHKTASLRRLDIRLLMKSSVDIEEEVTQYAKLIGLSVGVNFTLGVSTHPCVEEAMNAPPIYAESVGRAHKLAGKCLEDGLILDTDTTWPVQEI
ncbi:hypothetical protein CVT24_011762 [Panaeolus cyanescens]|uniref:F-box domain-containing protein n=1 Tax=Panaeolus cyanescens TaxID=181874 RepID=A0A409YNP7_9AGAR|nr:hypothetical protein CVT24_011762 [Panaeolus cyanescens]